ncbi:MAG: cysteine synthase A [Dehalococcoidia bacterium]
MASIVQNILELIGNTPLVRLGRLPQPGWAVVLAKLESMNPSGSVKDRPTLAIIEEAEAQGQLKPGDTIVEATGGNTGISLAMIAAAKGYRAVVVMPEGVSDDHRRLLLSYGAEVMLTPAAEGMIEAGNTVERLLKENPGYFALNQFQRPANPEAHRRATAVEILKATRNGVDAFVAGIGTGGTITGVGQALKAELPAVLVVGVEPSTSPLLSQGQAGRHGIPGLGAGFIPQVLERKVLDEVIPVSEEQARETASRLAREEGILTGISAGANVFAALAIAQRLGAGKTVVTVLPDTGQRYLNSLAIREDTAELSSARRGT